nr:hypothetical protein BaRGS_022788 [Batillaria attramentaria]
MGVQIPNFGTFALSQKRLEVGQNKFVLLQRPVFNISEKFAQNHGLQFTKYTVPGHIPTPSLNFAALSFETPFDRDTVDNCVREIISSVSRAVAGRRNVELAFAGIGRLQIRDSRVKMRFYKEFVNQMDGTGNLLESMQNRAGTVDSVMSNRPFSRPGTSNTLVLPRIQPGNTTSNNALPPLAEQDENPAPVPSPAPGEGGTAEDIVKHIPDKPEGPEPPVLQEEMEQHIATDAIRTDAFGEQEVGDTNTQLAAENVLTEEQMNQEPVDVYMPKGVMEDIHAERKAQQVQQSRAPSRMAMPLAKASGISLLDDLVPSNATPKLSPVPPPDHQFSQAELPPGLSKPLKPPTPPRLAPLHRSRSAEDMTGEKPKDKPLTPPGTSCGHPQAGQELCYLCHQRSRRNVPVSFTEERRRREEEEDRLLQQYQTMKDAEDILKEQERHISRRHDLQKISAFNLGVAEAVTVKKKAKDTEPQRSYIFQRRPLTPPRFPKQEAYLRDLVTQVEVKDNSAAKKKADEEFLERLEQVQLAEDLAAQREQYIRDKYESVETYKRALDTQLRYKPVPLPPREPDTEVFGKNDTTNEKLAERRRRAQQLFQEQQELVGQRKREAILQRLAEQERDQAVLHRTKAELCDDRAFRYKARYENRRRLEDNWMKAAETKRARDLEERLLGLESGQLLHEQCDRYNRCKQCKRRLNNCGETNIWTESRYIPGSRIIV